jgi:hypothetical protein
VNADLFFLLALQQTCKGENSELALSSLLSFVVPLHTSPALLRLQILPADWAPKRTC